MFPPRRYSELQRKLAGTERRFSDEELATKSAEEKADLADKFYQETELRLKQAEKTMKQVGYCFWQDLQNVVLSKFGFLQRKTGYIFQ